MTLPNVHLLGRKPYADLPACSKGFDVALNPFRINELTHNANPLKVRAYLAAGLPAASTDIPEVSALGWCRIGRSRDEFPQEVDAALKKQSPHAEASEWGPAAGWPPRPAGSG